MKKRVLLLVLAVLALTFALVSCGHKHDFKESEVITEATCDTAGKAKFVCECGESEEREIAAKGHTFDGETLVVEPTCWTDGYSYKECSVCKAESEHTDTVKADSKYHKFDEEKITVKPDCATGTEGVKKTVCSVCGAEDPKGQNQLIAAEHDYEEIRTEPTCQAPGSIKQVCKNCEVSGAETILEQLPHDEKLLETTAATCDKDGVEKYECKVCGDKWDKKVADALGHKWSETRTVVEATCTDPKYSYIECTVCHAEQDGSKQVEGVKLGHDIAVDGDDDYEQYNKIILATCITNGSITPICRRCNEVLDIELDDDGNSYVTVLDATGDHKFTIEEFTKEATCHEAKYTQYKCSDDKNCTETNKVYDGVKLDHVYSTEPQDILEAKCNAEGYKKYVCTICPDKASVDAPCECDECIKTDVLEKTEHKQIELLDTIEATCTEKAYNIYKCNDCGRTDVTKELNDPLKVPVPGSNDFVRSDEIVKATCTSEGYVVYYCTLNGGPGKCEHRENREFERREEHSFTEYIDGRYVCNGCGVTYRDITTYMDEAIAKGPLVIDDENTTLNWELIGYQKPTDAKELKANEATVVYEAGENVLDITGGMIKLDSKNGATYTVVIEYEGGSKTIEVDKATAYIDLYVNAGEEVNGIGGTVLKVTVTATADATVSVCAYEG